MKEEKPSENPIPRHGSPAGIIDRGSLSSSGENLGIRTPPGLEVHKERDDKAGERLLDLEREMVNLKREFSEQLSVLTGLIRTFNPREAREGDPQGFGVSRNYRQREGNSGNSA